MSIDGEGARASSTERREGELRDDFIATGRSGNTTGVVLGGLLGLLLLAGAIYYFTGDRAGAPGVAGPSPRQSSEEPATAAQPRPANAEKPVASSTTPPQPASPQSPPPSATVSSQQSPAATSVVETPKAPPAANAPANMGAAGAESSPASASQSAANTRSSDAQRPMRDQPAALPDQPAGPPKTEVILVVKRGPANIRSAPGRAGRVIAAAAKNAQLKEISRTGGWVEVETESGRGWISAALLAPL